MQTMSGFTNNHSTAIKESDKRTLNSCVRQPLPKPLENHTAIDIPKNTLTGLAGKPKKNHLLKMAASGRVLSMGEGLINGKQG